jgi:hypothetical protein
MKQKLVLAIVISIGLAVLTLSAIAQTMPSRQPPDPEKRGAGWRPGTAGDLPQAYQPIQSEEAKLASQTHDLVRQLGEAKDDAEKDKIKTKLTGVLEKQFDLRQKRHTSQLEELETQVKKLKELVQKRQDNRRDIISKRLDQLEREARGLGW